LKLEQAQELLRLGIRQGGDTLLCPEPMASDAPRSLTHELPRCPAHRWRSSGAFHDLRHSHATQLLLAGIHPKVAQERLGHSSISVTLDLYSHVGATMQEDAAAKLDTAFGMRYRTPANEFVGNFRGQGRVRYALSH